HVLLYYRENSFGLLEDIDFKVHGVHVGTGGPVRLSKPVADYYSPHYVGAHVDLVKSSVTFPYNVVFDGRERITLNLQSQSGGRPGLSLDLKFSAILASRDAGNFPVQIKFLGTEVTTITVKR